MKQKKQLLKLSPRIITSDIVDKYIVKLNEILSDKDCKNVAIIGGYGTGKSSILKTYLHRNKKIAKQTLTVTIGSYTIEEGINGWNNKLENKEILLVNRVEESILKQIIYREKFSKFPKSSLIRLDKESIYKKIIYIILILYSMSYILFYFAKAIGGEKNFIDSIFSMYNIYGIIMLIILIFWIYKIVNVAINSFKISKITIKNCEIDLHQETKSLFSRYLTEIIYYFQVTKKRIIIFEDLDRFPNDVVLKVIEELKELNTILNGSHGIKQMVFLYAIKDSLFNNAENKNKFFDYNLSILPVSTIFNSELNLVGLLKQEKIYNDLSPSIIRLVSKYVYDMRTLINIINDYINFQKILNTQNNDKLFAMSAFKNQCFIEFNNLQTPKDPIDKVLKTAEFKRTELLGNLNNERDEIIQTIHQAKKEHLKSIAELKKLLLFYNEEIIGSMVKPITHYVLDDDWFPISEFLSDEFNILELEKAKFELVRNNRIISEDILFTKFKDKTTFLFRCKTIFNNNTIDECNAKLEEVNERISATELCDVNEVFKKYLKDTNLDLNSKEKNQFLYELIAYGFIGSDYMDYVTSPVIYHLDDIVESLTSNDSKFLMDVRQGKLSFSTRLTGFNTIISQLENDFDSPYILNYDLLNYLIETKKTKYSDRVIKQYSNIDLNKIRFLISFFKKHHEQINVVLNKFNEFQYDLWNGFESNIDMLTKSDGFFLAEILLKNDTYLENNENNYQIKEYIEKYISKNSDLIDIWLQNENIRKNFLKLKPRLYNIADLDYENYKYVYENDMYVFNQINIYRIINSTYLDLQAIKKDKKTINLYNYIERNVKQFCDEYYINFGVKLDKEISNLMFWHEDISDDAKQLILRKENIRFRNINKIKREFLSTLIIHDRLDVNWKNILSLYKKVDTDLLFGYITINLKKLITKKISKSFNIKTVQQFFNEYYIYLLKTDLEQASLLMNVYKPNYEFVSNVSSEAIKLLIKNNCIDYNKTNYKYICQFLSLKERGHYIIGYYFSKNDNLTSLLNVFCVEDVEMIANSKEITLDESLKLLYELYKKEKRKSETFALESFNNRLQLVFRKNKWHKVKYNRIIYNNVLKKLVDDAKIKKIDVNHKEISFIL